MYHFNVPGAGAAACSSFSSSSSSGAGASAGASAGAQRIEVGRNARGVVTVIKPATVKLSPEEAKRQKKQENERLRRKKLSDELNASMR